jgi:hypothetical protein
MKPNFIAPFALLGLFQAFIHADTISTLSDNFDDDAISENWEAIPSDFEVGIGDFTQDTTTNEGQLTFSGTTTSPYWGGQTLQSVDTFSSSEDTTVKVDRISLEGSGTAWRSSIWLWQDGGDYIHFAQNVGENGWQYNPTNAGGGTNLGPFDGQDSDGGNKEMMLVYRPLGDFDAEVDVYLDGELGATHAFTNWDNSQDFHIRLSGMARAENDTVIAVFDNFSAELGLPAPTLRFNEDPITGGNATAGTAYSGTLAGSATDPEEDPLTYSKTAGPAWLTVAGDGTLSGTPSEADAGVNQFTVVVTDGNDDSDEAILKISVINLDAPSGLDAVFGWWPLNEGSGNVAADISGNGRDAVILRVEDGGLGDDGGAWIEDPECGMVLSFNGDDGTGAYAIMTEPGNPEEYGELPLFTEDNTFSWSLWVNADDNGANNDIILGNRYQPGGGEFSPRQFIKFDSNNFEFDTNNVQGVDYDDIVDDEIGKWTHHVVVKQGVDFTYYRDGVEAGTGIAGGAQSDPMPLFFGGQGDFDGATTNELWAGRLFDVRLYTSALSAADVDLLFNSKGAGTSGGTLFQIVDLKLADGDVEVFWNSRSGKEYTVEFSDNLSDWSELTDGVEAEEGGVTSYIDTTPTPETVLRYYRITEL